MNHPLYNEYTVKLTEKRSGESVSGTVVSKSHKEALDTFVERVRKLDLSYMEGAEKEASDPCPHIKSYLPFEQETPPPEKGKRYVNTDRSIKQAKFCPECGATLTEDG